MAKFLQKDRGEGDGAEASPPSSVQSAPRCPVMFSAPGPAWAVLGQRDLRQGADPSAERGSFSESMADRHALLN